MPPATLPATDPSWPWRMSYTPPRCYTRRNRSFSSPSFRIVKVRPRRIHLV
jgi:hypothetical protein